MAGFRVLLDDLGIETATAWCVECQVIVNPEKKKAQRYKAVSVVALSTDSTTSGALKGAAWGVFVAGGLGAAVGAMMGGGMKVAFELHTEEGEVLRCIAGKNAYLEIKKQVEAKAEKAERAKAKLAKKNAAKTNPEDPVGRRVISKRLLVATAILPIPFALGFFRKGYTGKARALAAVWTVLWCIGWSKLPDPPADTSATQEQSAAATPTGDEEMAKAEVVALASSDTPNVEKMRDPVQQRVWIARTQDSVRNQMREYGSIQFRRTQFKLFQGRMPMVCGELNAANGIEGRSGFHRFIASGETFGPITEEMMAPGEFAETWRQICG